MAWLPTWLRPGAKGTTGDEFDLYVPVDTADPESLVTLTSEVFKAELAAIGERRRAADASNDG